MASVAIENTLFAEEREANRLKDEFLATLSHELRTPLNAILGWTQLLRADDVSPHDLTHGLEVIERNVKAQTRLIEDLLDVSRITTGKLRLNVRPMSLPAVVNGAVESARPAADAKGIRLESDVLDGIGELPGDPDRLQQVIWNLLSNAIKFTPSGGTVRVELARTPSGAAVHVRDTGRGIHPSFLPYVFDRFRQADSSSTRSHGGLGLGLTIVKHLVELHGGSVQAGHGSTFTVELPERPASAPAPRVAQDNGKERPGRPVPERLPDVEGIHVLAVDDEPDARELIRHVLERARVRVTMASSAEEALGLIDRLNPDVLVSDIGMPGTDGYMFIRQVRQRTPDRSGTVPAIALTAYVREEDRQKMIAAGFTAHVPKPLDANELVRTVGHLSGRTLFRRPEPELKRA
jgi:CheY-like chemotaxis protein